MSDTVQTPFSMKLPDKVPVFPLPNTVLFPQIEVPLYVFESRYRKMLADCCSGDKFMAISLYKKGWEEKEEPIPCHPIVGVGFVHAVFENSDGTSNIILRGISRAKIVRYTRLDPYRIAKIEPLQDKISNKQELFRLARQLRRLLLQKLKYLSDDPEIFLQLPQEYRNPLILSHIASNIIQEDFYTKQTLLENVNSNTRLKSLIKLLKQEILPDGTQN